tara:strand:+ start:1257 stop:1781 length:525 start_codon:yes stop_codon:yes gene_type:complete
MSKKLFFNSKKNFLKSYLYKTFFFFIIIFIFFLILSIFFKKQNFFIIPNYNSSFYDIPENKEGIKIKNINKKSLNFEKNMIRDLEINNNEIINFSIQFFVSDNYKMVNNQLNSYILKHNLDRNDFYILLFDYEIGFDYLLLYKNFKNRKNAYDYCLKNLFFLDQCIIVNGQKIQ